MSSTLLESDLDTHTITKAYARWAPVYDLVFGAVFERGRHAAIAAAERVGGRVLEVGVDDFVKHHKRVAQDAVKAANTGVVKLEAVHRDRDRKAAEDEELRLTATERERQKARRVKFD